MQQGNHAYKYDFSPKERFIEGLWIKTPDGKQLGGTLEPRTLEVVLGIAKRFAGENKLAPADRGCRQILDVCPGHKGALALLGEIEFQKARGSAPPFKQGLDFQLAGKWADAEASIAKFSCAIRITLTRRSSWVLCCSNVVTRPAL